MKELNELRKKVLLLYALSMVLIVIGFAFIMTGWIIPFMISGIGLLLYNALVFHKRFKKDYKRILIKDALSGRFEISHYDQMGFDKETVARTGFIPMGNTYHSDDYIKGSYQGVPFVRSDVCSQEIVSTGKSTTVVTLFEGSWTVFDLPYDMNSYLLLRHKKFMQGKPGGLFKKDKTNKVRVETEDIDFNKDYEVFAQNEHDAFYLLTPKRMEMFRKLDESIDGNLIVGVMNNKLHILFDTRKNMMEPSLFSEITERTADEIRRDMDYIPRIIERLGDLRDVSTDDERFSDSNDRHSLLYPQTK